MPSERQKPHVSGLQGFLEGILNNYVAFYVSVKNLHTQRERVWQFLATKFHIQTQWKGTTTKNVLLSRRLTKSNFFKITFEQICCKEPLRHTQTPSPWLLYTAVSRDAHHFILRWTKPEQKTTKVLKMKFLKSAWELTRVHAIFRTKESKLWSHLMISENIQTLWHTGRVWNSQVDMSSLWSTIVCRGTYRLLKQCILSNLERWR